MQEVIVKIFNDVFSNSGTILSFISLIILVIPKIRKSVLGILSKGLGILEIKERLDNGEKKSSETLEIMKKNEKAIDASAKVEVLLLRRNINEIYYTSKKNNYITAKDKQDLLEFHELYTGNHYVESEVNELLELPVKI